MSPAIAAFSGPISSGKTTLSRHAAQSLGCTWASFGQFVRFKAQGLGMDPISREKLQDLGESLVNDNVRLFCSEFLEFARWTRGSLIADGMRHIEVRETLLDLTGVSTFWLVFVDAPWPVRRARAEQGGENLIQIDKHPVESHIEQLKEKADFVISTTDSLEVSTAAVVQFLGPRM
jgi:hypothetical protein